MEQNAQAAAFWNGIDDNLSAMVSNLQKQYDLLSGELSNSQTYFSNYIEGNTLNADFYT
jgi:hypothetical protein